MSIEHRFLQSASYDPSRRDVLRAMGAGLAGASLLPSMRLATATRAAARAKHVIFLFMTGGPSQMDLFDFKPELQRSHGKTAEHEREPGVFEPSTLLASKRGFQRFGQTGQWCSDAFRWIPEHMDELAVVKSLHTDSFVHESALLEMNSGQPFQGHPSMGAWVHYALGSENRDLPGFVVMHDERGGPISGPMNWSNGYMPAEHQGTCFRPRGEPILNLAPGARAGRAGWTREMEREQVELMGRLNGLHLDARPGRDDLAARDESYRLARRMQTAAPEALDLSGETEETLELYGFREPPPTHRLALPASAFGRQCLIARRLIERGVRFVQIYHGGGHQQQTWDAHLDMEENLAIHCPEVDRPIHGLLTDLKRTGLLDETLVVWGGEFGRMPVSQRPMDDQVESDTGRGHNPKAFTMWLAGAGIRPGSFGGTDELGFTAAENPRHVRDLHATILHLLGLDHERVTYHYGGLDRKLTGVEEARVIEELLA